MSIAFASLWWFVAVGLIVPLAWVLWVRGRSLGRARRAAAVLTRLAVLVILAMLLADAVTVREADRLAVVLVVDASESVDRFAAGMRTEDDRLVSHEASVEAALRRLGAGRGPDDLLGVVVFGGRAAALSTPTTANIDGVAVPALVAGGTDIAGALRLAAGLIPPDASGRIVLVSDGNATTGDPVAAAERIASSAASGSLRIDTVPVAFAVGGETIVEAVGSPSTASADSVVPVRVEIASTAGTRGVLRIRHNDRPVSIGSGDDPTALPLTLGPGRHVVTLDVPIGDRRMNRFQADFEPEASGEGFVGDAQLDNNRAEGFTLAPGEGGFLIVDDGADGGRAPGSDLLAQILGATGASVRVIGASALPQDLLGLQEHDLIVLNNVPADAIAPRAQAALASHVAEVGCGLILVGGRSSFGAGGWVGSPIEPLLPVRLDLAERLVERRTAIVFVLDRSGSMGATVGGTLKSQQQIANSAAAGAAATLGSRDLVGAVAFGSDALWVVELAENEDPDATASRILGITSGGGTNLLPGLQLARDALAPVEASVKHIIVLSDGQSRGAELLPEFAEALAAEGINISTISVGDRADTDTMFQMADRGGGVHYAVTNPSVLPRVFVRAVRTVRDPLIKEGRFVPVRMPAAEASTVLDSLSDWPGLGGLVLTRFREEPTVVDLLATDAGEPVASHWPAELGRVGVFTSDVGRWAEEWRGWDGFERFWSQFARAMAKSPVQQGLELTTEIIDGRAVYRLIALDDAGRTLDGLDVEASVYEPGGSRRSLRLEQVGPGEYAGELPVGEPGVSIAVIRPSQRGRALPPVVGGVTHSASLEYQRLTPDEALLASVAQVGGGEVVPISRVDAAFAYDRTGMTPRRVERSLVGPLLIALLAAFLLDVAVRRIAWDRFLESRPIAEPAPSRAAAHLDALRSRVAQTAPAASGSAPVLTERDAEAVAASARAHRMKAKRAQRDKVAREHLPQAHTESEPTSEQAAASAVTIEQPGEDTQSKEEPGGLLAAKRRASARYRDDA
ncbi:MAG: VWA domain-containing protein [Planctomycetota bacterium]